MSSRFKNCLILAFFVTVFFVFGPGGIIMALLIIPAGMSIFPNSAAGQLMVVIVSILTFVLPVFGIAGIFNWIANLFLGPSKPIKKVQAGSTSKNIVVRNSSGKSSYYKSSDDIIDGEWTEVN